MCSATGNRRSASRCAPDGLSVMMLAVTAVVMAATGLFRRASCSGSTSQPPTGAWRRASGFLLMGLWSGLNLVFVSQDLFNLYVALELLTFAAVRWSAWTGAARRWPQPCAT